MSEIGSKTSNGVVFAKWRAQNTWQLSRRGAANADCVCSSSGYSIGPQKRKGPTVPTT